jgi:hypothetical protein
MLELNRNKIDEVSGGIGVAVAIAVASSQPHLVLDTPATTPAAR